MSVQENDTNSDRNPHANPSPTHPAPVQSNETDKQIDDVNVDSLCLQVMSDVVDAVVALKADILMAASELDEHCKNVNIARVTGSSVAVATGGLFCIIGNFRRPLQRQRERERDREIGERQSVHYCRHLFPQAPS